MEEILLNKEQKEAVESTEGPLLIIAGAGAGKTRVITQRIINLIKKGVEPKDILAVTFTNKAAKEMKARIKETIFKEISFNSVTEDSYTPQISTFHALGVKIIKENSHLLGIKKHFTIYDRSDSIKTIKECAKELGFDPKNLEPKKILSIISKQKGEGVEVTDITETLEEYNFIEKIAIEIWDKYEKRLKKQNALDFDDLLLKTKKILQDPEILKHYQNKWKYIHIDEYQDTNKIQDELTKLLSKKHQNICVVGDIDQNIFSWRGADIKNLLLFEKRYPNLKTIFLEQNYRSTGVIIDVSNKIIEKNQNRPKKAMFTQNAPGEKIGIYVARDEKEEGYFIAQKTIELLKNKVDAAEIVILYRTNFQSRALEEAFINHKIPYQVLGVKFFERKEIKDALAFLKLAFNSESLIDFKRAVEAIPRGIGKVTLERVATENENLLKKSAIEKLFLFRKIIENIKKTIETSSPSVSMKYVIKESGLEKHYSKNDEDSVERLQNLKELVSVAENYDKYSPKEGVELFLEDAILRTEQESLSKEEHSVKLMTTHAVKGLEFKYTFITGLEQGLFPHENMNFDTDSKDDEEERRLFYVAITRAKKKAFLTYSSSRTIYGARQVNTPSEFLSDIDEEFLEIAKIEEEKIKF